MAWLWFFSIGLAIYLGHLPFRKKNQRYRIWIFIGSGTLAAVPAAFFGAPGVAAFHVPAGLIIVLGTLAGTVLYWSEERKWFERFWLRFFLTFILGVTIACILILVFVVYSAMNKSAGVLWKAPLLVVSTISLMGLLTAFGYTLPERWFAKKGNET